MNGDQFVNQDYSQKNKPLPLERPGLLIWGASGHALVVADIVRRQDVYQIVGFLDDVHPERRDHPFCGAQILGGQEQLSRLRDQGVNHVLLGFGNCLMRLELTETLQKQGFILPIAIHPHACVAADVFVGEGTVIAAGAVVNPGVKIGRSVIINTSASVDHECLIEDAVHISPGVHLAGRVTVGIAAQVGIGATVIDRRHIGSRSMIGAGAVVVDDIPANALAYGVPAKVVRRIDDES
jgi:UDP-N-acetylbacillosamine N-acetyltransferase